jgi:hypothetical protein
MTTETRWRLIPVYSHREGRAYPGPYPWMLAIIWDPGERLSHDTREAAQRWCFDELGPTGDRWGIQGWDFVFRDHVDAVAFQMRWG